jgi:predicted amidohydrolase YtcJ
MHADTVIRNGKVITVDENFSIKEAIAVKDGWILFVGSDEDVKRFIGKHTNLLDLKGKPILPGVNDSHGHAALFGGTRPPLALDLSYPTVRSIKDIASSLATKVKTVRPGEWIRGFGWDPPYLEECQADTRRYPSRWDIDTFSPSNPVIFNDFSGHTLWVNSKALELSGVNKETPDPPGGIIVRDPETGDLTGIFKEPSAQGLVMKVAPLLTKEEKRAAICSAMQVMNSNGITSYTESALGPGGNQLNGGLLGEECIEVYGDLFREGRLTTRVSILLLFGQYGGLSFSDLKEGLKNYTWPNDLNAQWLRSAGIKIFADGVPISKTSWMWQEYIGGSYGSLTIPGETDEEKCRQLKEMILYCHERGFQVGVHATGDRAISATIDGFAEAIRGNPRIHNRQYIIHGDFITPQDIERAAKYRIGINMQPYIQSLIADAEPLIVGPQRAACEWPFKTVVDSGIHLTFSSDLPVTYPNWRQGVQSAVLREAVGSGKVSGPKECIKREEAIRAYTIQGAWQDGMEQLKGSIERGKLADFCILGEDLLTVEPHEIKDIPVVMTVAGGKIVYDTSGGAFK